MIAQVDRIRSNVARTQQRIAEAAARVGRSAADVRLVAVTKYADVALTRVFVEAGCSDLGESRPQQLWNKAEQLSYPADPGVTWHLIGPLQRNKARRTARVAHWIHSIDSWELLSDIDRAAAEWGTAPQVLLEVNISGDQAKHGFTPAELREGPSWPERPIAARVRGLMGMSGLDADPVTVRRQFAGLRELRDELIATGRLDADSGQLSMGMSGDYELAVEEGATLVRVGSVLYEGLDVES